MKLMMDYIVNGSSIDINLLCIYKLDLLIPNEFNLSFGLLKNLMKSRCINIVLFNVFVKYITCIYLHCYA